MAALDPMPTTRDAEEFASIVNELRDRCKFRRLRLRNPGVDAYLDNTAQHIDLANPDRVAWGGAMKNESQRFQAIVHPLIVLPDSFALSGKLQRVASEIASNGSRACSAILGLAQEVKLRPPSPREESLILPAACAQLPSARWPPVR